MKTEAEYQKLEKRIGKYLKQVGRLQDEIRGRDNKIDELVKCVEAMVQDKKIAAPETWFSKRARKCLERLNGTGKTI